VQNPAALLSKRAKSELQSGQLMAAQMAPNNPRARLPDHPRVHKAPVMHEQGHERHQRSPQ